MSQIKGGFIIDTQIINAFRQTDAGFPAILRELPDPPRILYVRGDAELLAHRHDRVLAVVGTRRITPYGQRVTKEIVTRLAKHFIIISGLAYGTDAAAHEAALSANGQTCAVLACGLDDKSIYPASHINLANRILKTNGYLISEHPTGTHPYKSYFPVRNRILAGLSVGVLIIEAGHNSGTLITARCALDYNRDVFVVPGSIFSDYSRATNELLKCGARCVTGADDIFRFYGITDNAAEPSAQQTILIDPAELSVLELLSTEPITINEIASRRGTNITETAQILMRLELAGRAIRVPGRGYTV